MAKAQTTFLSKFFKFPIGIQKLQDENHEICSPEIIINETVWKIKVHKRVKRLFSSVDGDIKGGTIDISFTCTCNKTAATKKWSCDATAFIKLLSSKGDKTPFIRKMHLTQFSDDCTTVNLNNFITWNQIMDQNMGYVNDCTIVFGIHIFINPLKVFAIEEIIVEETIFRVFIQNVLALDRVYSSKSIIQGIEWHIAVIKTNGSLGIYVFCDHENIDINWSYKANTVAKLLTIGSTNEIFESKWDYTFRRGEFARGREIITWETFIDKKNGYVSNGNAYIEIKLNVSPPEPLWNCEEDQLKQTSGLVCPICLERFSDCIVFATKCGHLFCHICIQLSIEQKQQCPLCKEAASKDELRKIFF